MKDPATTVATPVERPAEHDQPFNMLEESLSAGGPAAALEVLIDRLTASGDYRALLDALLLKARHELALPLVTTGPLAELPEPGRTRYEEKYVAAIRLVGSKYLELGDIPTAWAYFRAIAENEPVAQAIRSYVPADNDERLGAIIEVAFNHGVEPRRGFELILERYGTCPAISSFEQLPPQDQALRTACAERLTRHLHGELTANLRSEIARQGGPLPPQGGSIAQLIEGCTWLFADDSYHIDVSHLAAVVRMSTTVHDRAVIALAADLTEYGRRLSPRLVFDGQPPFEQIFDDHRIYLRAILGHDVDSAVAHFQAKVDEASRLDGDAAISAQALVNLLVRLDRLGPAIDVAATHLAGFSEAMLACPTVAQLCQRARDPERLARIARQHGDLVNFAAGLLQSQAAVGSRP
jgi:hypothetical protein